MTDWIAFWLFCSIACVTWSVAAVFTERTRTKRWEAYYARPVNCAVTVPSSHEIEEEEADDE